MILGLIQIISGVRKLHVFSKKQYFLKICVSVLLNNLNILTLTFTLILQG